MSAIAIAALGLVLVAPGGTMDMTVIFEPMLRKWPESVWGLVCIAIGFVRIGALAINGRAKLGSPAVRGVGAAVGLFPWLWFAWVFCAGTARLGAIPFPLPLVFAFIGADVLAVFQSAKDFFDHLRRARENERIP